MIEFVTIGIHGSVFSAHYIGARSTSDCAYRHNETDVSRLQEFVDLLTQEGFAEFNRSDEMGIVSYMRKDAKLALGDSDE